MTNEWLPVVAGWGGLVVIIAVASVLPRSWIWDDLTQRYGVRPSGAYLVMTRRDIGRRAAYSAAVAALLLAAPFALFPIGEHFPNESQPRMIIEAYSFISFVLGAVATLAAAIAAFHAIFWRARTVAMSRERILDLANYVDLMRQGKLSFEAWRDFSAVRFDDSVIEGFRGELVTRIGPIPRVPSDDDLAWLEQAAAQLLAQAG